MAWIEPIIFWGCVVLIAAALGLWGWLVFTTPAPHSPAQRDLADGAGKE